MPHTPGADKELDALLDSIAPADELASPFLKAVVYGPFGTGKTVLSATAGKKILFIDSGENGWVSLLNHPELYANIAHRMPFVSLKQLDVLGDRLIAGTFPLDIDTVVIDTVSDIQKKDLDQIVAYRCKQDPDKNPNIPSMPDYNENNNRLRRTLTKFRDAPVNFVMVSQERSDENKSDTGLKETRLAVSDAIGKTIAQMTHLFAYLDVDGEGADRKFILQVHRTKRPNIQAKTRIGGLPVKIEKPNLSEIFGKWATTQVKDK